MDLIVWRHADAEDANSPEADMARCLSARGIRQATRMAQWLDRKLPDLAHYARSCIKMDRNRKRLP